ncbi:MAG: formate dehydrogenase accessory sulfurtransferase FdhD [Woeseiaceae bacterium]|nr:formate dehydrogenase accessory sulfurtransferase FdhD [Woeseiaceae bacterium]
MSGSSLAVGINRVDGVENAEQSDVVAVEEPLEIQLCSATAAGSAARSISITMRTPGEDAELALGFLFTEGIIESAKQVASVAHQGETDPDTGLQNTVRVELTPNVEIDLGRLERHFYTTSSCGVCGKASLDALRVAGQRSLAHCKDTYRRQLIVEIAGRVRKEQPVFSETGGLHAAAVFDPQGKILVVKEDVGRHNATDKAIGALLQAGALPANSCGLFVSGRASFELMQKALVAGIPLLAAVGAPSSLAVKMAKEFDMTLIGFLRGDKFNIYAGAQRIV